jgi:outer membrane protein OmpA-like peptidoglycan-associated protein
MKALRTQAGILAVAFVLSGCAGTTNPWDDASDTQKGAVIGAAGGAILGAIFADKHKGTGALIGAIGGGIAGGLVGNYMEKQKQDLEKILVAERDSGAITIEKLPDNSLRITMTAQTAFDTNSAEIKGGFYTTLDKIAEVVNRYGKTTLTVVGYTDNTGSAQYNQQLSERRAEAVKQAFLNRGVHPERLAAVGKGMSEPRASNDTPEGRQLNRRVEIIVEPVVAPS